MEKKAGTKLLTIWWFLVLVMIAAGIILATSLFYADKLDVRQLESAVMINKLAGCLTNGYLNEEIFSGKFFKDCYFDENIINGGDYFIKISTLDINSNTVQRQISFGNNAFEADCKISEASSAEKFPRCSERILFALNSSGEMVKLNLIAGSNNEFRK